MELIRQLLGLADTYPKAIVLSVLIFSTYELIDTVLIFAVIPFAKRFVGKL